MASDLNISGWKMSDFVSFLLFGFTLVIKHKFLFLKSLEYFNFFNKKNDVKFEYVLPNSV